MPMQITSEQEETVRELVRAGEYSSEQHVIDEALKALKELNHLRSSAQISAARQRAKSSPTLESLRLQREEILALARKHGASNVRVFGSVARGVSRPDSDIDFLVDFDPQRSLLDRAGLQIDLEELLHVHVDVATIPALKPAIRERVVNEAVAL